MLVFWIMIYSFNNLERDFMKELIFVVDPMCSWCWGFHPVMQTLHDKYTGRYTFSIVLGGLRGEGTMSWDDKSKLFLKQHWDAVHKATGQPFNPTILNRSYFDYNTHPSCKAVITVRELWGEKEAFKYLGDIQKAFYKEGKDITSREVLKNYLPMSKQEAFLDFYNSKRAILLLGHDFSKARSMGANTFPSIVTIDTEGHMLCISGYKTLEEILTF